MPSCRADFYNLSDQDKDKLLPAKLKKRFLAICTKLRLKKAIFLIFIIFSFSLLTTTLFHCA